MLLLWCTWWGCCCCCCCCCCWPVLELIELVVVVVVVVLVVVVLLPLLLLLLLMLLLLLWPLVLRSTDCGRQRTLVIFCFSDVVVVDCGGAATPRPPEALLAVEAATGKAKQRQKENDQTRSSRTWEAFDQRCAPC